MATLTEVLKELAKRPCAFQMDEKNFTRNTLIAVDGVNTEHHVVGKDKLGFWGGGTEMSIDQIKRLSDRWPQDGWYEVSFHGKWRPAEFDLLIEEQKQRCYPLRRADY